MAGATNRALKAAGVPKSTIKTLRVESGGRLNLRSAIQIASARGLDTGKAHEHLARRDAKTEAKRASGAQAQQQKRVATLQRSTVAAGKAALAARKDAAIRAIRDKRAANRPEVAPAPGTAQQRLRREAARATYSGVVKHPETGEKRRVIASSGTEYAARVATAKKALQANYERTPDAKYARDRVKYMQDGAAAVRAAGTPPKGHAFSAINGGTEAKAHKIVAQNAAFFAYRADSEKKSFVVVHKGTGLSTATLPSKGAAEQYMAGTAKSGGRIMDRVVAGDQRAFRAVGKYGERQRAAVAAATPQAKAAVKREEKKAADEAFTAAWRAKGEKRDARRLAVAQRLTSMVRKAKSALNKAGVDVYHAQLDAKKNGWDPVRAAERKAESAEARVKHLEARAKKLRVDPKRTYSAVHDLLY